MSEVAPGMTVEGTSFRERCPLASEAGSGTPGAGAGSRPEAIAEVWYAECEAYRAVIRWRVICERARGRMERTHPATAAGFHHRLKDREYPTIEAHQAAVLQRRVVCGVAREGRA